mmetsp:Transcript_44428/g.71979  ORF Transcript_44428/g.71979 Transcript_44428/m.71979 type:complete len:428 (-) Transcript_44428:188-1471(-)
MAAVAPVNFVAGNFASPLRPAAVPVTTWNTLGAPATATRPAEESQTDAALGLPAAALALASLTALRGAARGSRRASGRGKVRPARSVQLQLGPRAAAECLESRPVDTARPTAAQMEIDGSDSAEWLRLNGQKLEVKPWDFLSAIAKDASRNWFVERAESRGIPWTKSVERHEAKQGELEECFSNLVNTSLEYPAYYTVPFHGYDSGNLTWMAAHELEAATQSMCLGYYDGMTWQESQEVFRGAARNVILDRWALEHPAGGVPKALLDVGCSGGFSTKEMSRAFPTAKATGLDMSPFFLSVAKQTYPDLEFLHANAEDTGLPDGSFEFVALNFILHELPLEASQKVLREANRLLAPGGVLAILDVNPQRLLELPPFRRWAFQVTEPWCKDGEYYSLDLAKELGALNMLNVQSAKNDPINALTLASKPL